MTKTTKKINQNYTPTNGELRIYLNKVVSEVNPLLFLAQTKRKTDKMKTAVFTLTTILQRAKGLKEFVTAGGDVQSIDVQEAISRPVINYWASQLGKESIEEDGYPKYDEWA